MQPPARTQRLLKDADGGPMRPRIWIWHGAGLAGIALISAVGATGTDQAALIAHAKLTAADLGRDTREHRRQVYNERRERFARVTDSSLMRVNAVQPKERSAVNLR